jgi:GxxExxY protein
MLDDPMTQAIIGCAMTVHRALGPGLFEATYEEALCIELADANMRVHRQIRVPVVYKDRRIGEYRPDLMVDDRVIIEIKSVERLIKLHEAQVLAYMRVLRKPIGLLINFNTDVLKAGLRRLTLSTLPASPPRPVVEDQ